MASSEAARALMHLTRFISNLLSLLLFFLAVSARADSSAKKHAFVEQLLPIIKQEQQAIIDERQTLQRLLAKPTKQLTTSEQQVLMTLAEKYQLKAFTIDNQAQRQELLRRVDILPVSLILAQAATESAWGQSRFALEGNNLFGQWCLQPGCGLVPKNRLSGKHHEVKRFASFTDSVSSYLRNLNSNHAYRVLREQRANLRQQGKALLGMELAEYLIHYSAQGQAYTAGLIKLIRSNHFDKFDR